jgi:putative oxidoreductase
MSLSLCDGQASQAGAIGAGPWPLSGDDMTASNVWTLRALSVLRIMAALLFLEHGTMKLLGFPAGSPPAAMTPAWYAGFFELIGGALLAIGLFSRPVAFILSGMTAVAYFMVHAPRGFFPLLNGGELAVLYCFVFLFLSFAGPGPWSLDAQLRRSGKLPAWV